MPSFAKLFSEVFRDYVTEAVPASGAHPPVKADIRAWGVTAEQALAKASTWLGSVAGTNTITGTGSPTVAAYVAGMVLFLVPANTNTGATTVNADSVGAAAVQTPDGDALAGGELIAGRVYGLVYTGSAFRVIAWPVLEGSATYDPASLADGAGATTTVTVTGAALGDYAVASFSNSTQGIILSASVTAANTVTVRFQNETTGVIDLASGTLRVRVFKA